MIKKILCLGLISFICGLPVFAKTDTPTKKNSIIVCQEHDMQIQKRINEIAFKILNANKIDKRIVFYYNSKDNLIKGAPEIVKRQIVIYDKSLQYAESDDELAAILAREISVARKSFDGSLGGLVSSAQVKMAPKKYELVSDRRAVEYLVKAGYNPVGLITFINKSCPQGRQDKISKHNLTSKRLMYIYEKIFFDYPYFLVNNEYLHNEYYQNFLLTSVENRKKLLEMARVNERGRVRYE